MIKPWLELYELDISQHISQKPTFKFDKAKGRFVETGTTLDYLSWADALTLLYKNGAVSVQMGILHAPTEHSLFLYNGELPEIRVYVEIDSVRRELTYPLIDGSTDIKMDKVKQSDIHNASQRAFVKCVAINWGLGLKLWQKEEKEPLPKPIADDTRSIVDRFRHKLSAAAEKLGGAYELYGYLGKKETDVKRLLASAAVIADVEHSLDGVLNDTQS